MTTAVLSIGSNIGDAAGHLQSVLDALGPRTRAVSAIYRTAPWGGVAQDDFLNAVLVAEDPDLGPRDWLALGQECERRAERVREVRWGPRTLDVDVVTCRGDDGAEIVSADPELLLPHPRAAVRAFVLVPWAEIEPEATVGGAAVAELIAALDPAERAGIAVDGRRLRMRPWPH